MAGPPPVFRSGEWNPIPAGAAGRLQKTRPMPSFRAVPALVALSTFLLVLPPPVAAQDAESIVRMVVERQQARWQANEIEDYTIVQETLGNRIPQYFEAFPLEMGQAFRLVPLTEIERRRAEQMGVTPLTPDQLSTMGNFYEMFGGVLADEMAREGVPIMPEMDPRRFGALANDMFQMAASYEENDGRGDARQSFIDMAEFGRRARVVGTEDVGGRPGFHLRVDDFAGIDLDQPDGMDFEMTRGSVWIDTEHYVPLRMLFEGTMTMDGEQAPVLIEKVSEDWSDMNGLFVARREIMRLGGFMVMDDAERREMQEALEQIQGMRQQLSQLPDQQREMVMSRMAPQIEQLERMARGEPFEVVAEIVEVRVNEGPPFDIAEIVFGR